MYSVEVTVHDPRGRWARAFDLREAQILAGGYRPWNINDLACPGIEALRQAIESGCQTLVECLCLHRGHGHSLAVDRIEAADCIAQGEIARRKTLHALVEATLICRESVADDVGDGAGRSDEIMNDG